MLAPGSYGYLESRCSPCGKSLLHQPIQEMVKRILGLEEGDPEEEVLRRVEEKIRDLDIENPNAFQALADLLSVEPEDGRYPYLGPQEREKRIFEAGRDLLVAQSRRRPLFVVLEDAQWIDQSSIEFVGSLGEALSVNRILLLLLYRPEFHPPMGRQALVYRDPGGPAS